MSPFRCLCTSNNRVLFRDLLLLQVAPPEEVVVLGSPLAFLAGVGTVQLSRGCLVPVVVALVVVAGVFTFLSVLGGCHAELTM
jgi:hypothetical protein